MNEVGFLTISVDRIKALLLRRYSDWCGTCCGRRSSFLLLCRSRKAAIEEQSCVLFSVFYCGSSIAAP